MARVIVPATTANLGPGFDVLGLALRLYNTFTVEETGDGLEIDIRPDNMHNLSTGEDNLVYRSARRLFDEVGYKPAGLRITIENGVPLGRGLGSSSTAIVGGLIAANEISGAGLPKHEIFALATDIEGHPDNVGPAVFGGFTICYPTDFGHGVVSCDPAENLKPVLLIPESMLETRKARGVLPQEVSMADAVFNISRVSLLVSVILTGKTECLRDAMIDRLHQPYRAPLVPGLMDIIEGLSSIKDAGVALSGAGPSILCLIEKGDLGVFLNQVGRIIEDKSLDYAIRAADFDLEGARVAD